VAVAFEVVVLLPVGDFLAEPSELEVLALVDDGKTNAEIAHILWVAPSTISRTPTRSWA
jgi:DNA-binding CsgD family transcriptional regulator